MVTLTTTQQCAGTPISFASVPIDNGQLQYKFEYLFVKQCIF